MDNSIKHCLVCSTDKPLSDFGTDNWRKDGLSSRCKTCLTIKRTNYEKSNPHRKAIANSKLKIINPNKYQEHLLKQKILYRERISLVLAHYGGKCACPPCQETNPLFLSIDHIDNNGRQHRKQTGSGNAFYLWIIRNNFPANLQILCMNCNWGKFRNGGVCPHVG